MQELEQNGKDKLEVRFLNGWRKEIECRYDVFLSIDCLKSLRDCKEFRFSYWGTLDEFINIYQEVSYIEVIELNKFAPIIQLPISRVRLKRTGNLNKELDKELAIPELYCIEFEGMYFKY